MILGACYLLWMLRKVLFGPLREPAAAPGAVSTTRPAVTTRPRPRGCPAGRLARDRRA